jgi:hypothetical protein
VKNVVGNFLSPKYVLKTIWLCQPATLPARFLRTFTSKLIGMRGRGETGQFLQEIVDELQVALEHEGY